MTVAGVSGVLTIFGWTPGLQSLISGTVLRCGCLTGTYATWRGATVVTVDARGRSCANPHHRANVRLDVSDAEPPSSLTVSVGDTA